jgi:opacity protein-like surface antigen
MYHWFSPITNYYPTSKDAPAQVTLGIMNIMNKTHNYKTRDQQLINHLQQKLRRGCAVVLALSCAFSAAADDAKSSNIENESPRYLSSALENVTANSGHATEIVETSKNADVTVTNIAADDSRIGWKLNIGFDVTDNVAIEAGYMDLNDGNAQLNQLVNAPELFFSNAKKLHHNATEGFSLGSSYHYNVSSNIGLTGSIGLFNWEGGELQPQSLNASPASGLEEGGTDVYFGLGGGYQLADDVTLKIEWERYQYNNDNTEMWSIGVNYHFK